MAQDKDKNTLNVPPLRFLGFTDEWKEATIGDVVNIGNGRDYKSLDSGNIPVFGTGGYMTSVNGYLYDGETVFIGRKGTIDKPFFYSGKFWTVDTLFYTYNFKHIMPKFLYGIFQRINWQKYNEASGVPSLSKGTIEKIKIKFPSSREQGKIAHLLSFLDERIVTQNKIIDNLQSLIKGLARTLTQQKEPNTRISECLECHTSTLQESVLKDSGKYPAHGASGIAGYLDEYSCDEDSILIIKDGSGVGTVSHVSGKYSVIGTLNYLTAKIGYSLEYLYYCLMSFNFEPFKTGMAIPHIYFKDYGRAKLWCPTIDEQKRIAMALTSIENKLNVESKILNTLYSEKQYFLDNMFI